jgi:hypothetical protein
MSDTPTPQYGNITLDERLERIDTSLIEIKEGMAEEKTSIALIQSKLALHDTILMGTCGVVGVAIVSAVMVMVLK